DRAPLPAARALLAGLCLGLALWFRQYCLALAPAFVLAYWASPGRWKRVAAFCVGPALALAAYAAVGGGLAPPSAATTMRFGGAYQAQLGLNPIRPLSALAYVGAYALALLPWGDRQRLSGRRLLELGAAGLALAVALVASGRSVWG